jgi:hypothetical protein
MGASPIVVSTRHVDLLQHLLEMCMVIQCAVSIVWMCGSWTTEQVLCGLNR